MSSIIKKEFLDLGRHPIANAFLQKRDFDDEFLFDLKVCLDEETKLVSIKEFVEPKKIFNFTKFNCLKWKHIFKKN